jgi:hypothetical protein
MKGRTMELFLRQAAIVAAAFAFAAGPGCAAPVAGEAPGLTGGKARSAGLPGAGWAVAPAKAGGSGITLRYRVPQALAPGEAALVRLELSNVTAAGAELELRAGDPAVQLLVDGQPPAGPITLVPGAVRALDVQVRAPDGLHFLNVFTRQGGRSSAASVPLRVGSGQARVRAQGTEVKTTPGGEKIIPLPGR